MEQELKKPMGTLQDATAWLRDFADKWVGPAGLGSVILYLFGYLSFRFHFSALGLPVEWNAIDERYFVAGMRAAVNLAIAVPLGLAMLILARAVTGKASRWLARRLPRLTASLAPPERRATLSVWFCLAALFGVFSACLDLIPLGAGGESRTWLAGTLLTWMKNGDGMRLELFLGLQVFLVAVGVSMYRWSAAAVVVADGALGAWTSFLRMTNGALLVLMALLLPVNYGVVVEPYRGFAAQRIGDDKEPLGDRSEAWLISESKDWLHYLVRKAGPDGSVSFASVTTAGVKRLELGRAANLLPVLLAPDSVGPCKESSNLEQKGGMFRIGPVNIMAEEPPVKAGDLMLVNISAEGQPLDREPVLVATGSFSWPVLQGRGEHRRIYAIRGGDELVCLQPGQRGRTAPETVARIPGLQQLVAFDESEPQRLVVKLSGEFRFYHLDNKTSLALPPALAATIGPIAAKQSHAYDHQTLEARAWDSGSRILLHGASGEVLVADCPNAICGQPALAPEGHQVVFVRARR